MLNKLFPWLYRFVALLFIFLFSFSTVYTISLFTPGIDGGGFPAVCPSAFSNPEAPKWDTAQEDLDYLVLMSQEDFNNTTRNADNFKDETDTVKRSILLKRAFVDISYDLLTTAKDKRINSFDKNVILQYCAQDRKSINKILEDTINLETQGEAVENSPTVLDLGYERTEGSRVYFRYLTFTNVALLWLLVIVLGVTLYFIRKKLGKLNKVNKIAKIVFCTLFTILFAWIAFAPTYFLYEKDGYYGKACSAKDGFDVLNIDKSDVNLLSTSETLETLRNSANTINELEEQNEGPLNQEQIDYFNAENSKVNKELEDIQNEIESTKTFKQQKADFKKADPICIREARLSYLITLCSIIALIMFWLFIKGKKDKDFTIEVLDNDDSKVQKGTNI